MSGSQGVNVSGYKIVRFPNGHYFRLSKLSGSRVQHNFLLDCQGQTVRLSGCQDPNVRLSSWTQQNIKISGCQVVKVWKILSDRRSASQSVRIPIS